MTTWFTSDEHLDDQYIVDICERPWKSAKDMSVGIINNVNELLKKGDVLYHIGDWCRYNPLFPKMTTMRCQQLMSMYKDGIQHHLILGNHDRLPPFDYVEMGFTSVHTSLIVGGMALVHDPCVFDIVKNKYTLACGHVHGLFKNMKGVVNVGVDLHDYKPITLAHLMNLSIEE